MAHIQGNADARMRRKMKQKILRFLKSDSFREIFLYIIIGGLTTVISYLVYWATTRLLLAAMGMQEVNVAIETAGTVLSHAVAIAFAFVANKKFVFRSPGWRGKAFWRELWTFTTARLLSLALDLGFMALAVGSLGMNDLIAKLIAQGIIIVANYLASKFWVFRKGGKSA